MGKTFPLAIKGFENSHPHKGFIKLSHLPYYLTSISFFIILCVQIIPTPNLTSLSFLSSFVTHRHQRLPPQGLHQSRRCPPPWPSPSSSLLHCLDRTEPVVEPPHIGSETKEVEMETGGGGRLTVVLGSGKQHARACGRFGGRRGLEKCGTGEGRRGMGRPDPVWN